ncbi:MAG: Peptidase M16 domain protein [Candidatus Magasanikbacteria bacterium GW2011_GWA2_46_17]|uniref:Peptidase M16 domain protein n=1 Tax=Candidatus Magasanikbacteria bacterium GW2011_GWA2_46_17 TaxID=1619042 RepID=A0A0G1NYJ8_9BACT|nr:MAG: Peptidase M16 domain protein [Candidatus Magasanikbacteria bacterium GW2011_GWA2_46_17]
MTFSKKILPNGLRLITVPMKDNPTVTVLVLVEAGSKYETKKINGVSHFLEHFVFKGTTKRPKPSDLSREFDSLGAQYNAFTSQEFTGYYAKAHKDKAEKVLDIVTDMYLDPLLPEAELEQEKGVIIQEIRMYQDEPARHVQDLFMELLYADQPAGWNIAGTTETVSGLTRDDLVKYRRRHYVAEATTIVISGGFEENILSHIENLFAGLPDTKKPEKAKVMDSQKAPAVLVKHKETDQTHIVLGARAFDTFDPKAPTLRVLSAILGGGMSSRLFVKLRDELGLCYYVSASPDLYADHGLFQVAVGADTKKVSIAINAIIDELKKLKSESVPEAELRKSKDFLIGNLYLGLESSDELAQFIGSQEALHKPLKNPEVIAKEIETVTVADIQNLARQIFVSSGFNLALIGPFKDKKQFLSLLHL